MFLEKNDYIVYCWRYEGDAFAKIGMSRAGSFWNRLGQAQTNDYRDVELLGIRKCNSRENAIVLEQTLLNNTFVRHRPDREWVYINQAVWDWLDRLPVKVNTEYFRDLNSNRENPRISNRSEYLHIRILAILARHPNRTARELRRDIHSAQSQEVREVCEQLCLSGEICISEQTNRTTRFSLAKV